MCEGNYKLSLLYCKIMLCDSLWETSWVCSDLKYYEKKISMHYFFSSASWTWMTEKGMKIRIKAKLMYQNQDK